MPIIVHVERARGLSWTHFWHAPNPYVEVYFAPGGVASAVSLPATREDSPEWPGFHARLDVPPTDATPGFLEIVVRDAGNRHVRLGRAEVRFAASVTEGWFPLTANATPPKTSEAAEISPSSEQGLVGNISRLLNLGFARSWRSNRQQSFFSAKAEVFVRIEWPEYCSLPGSEQVFPDVTQPVGPENATAEMRSVSDKPGQFFRCGELLVSVNALSVPLTLRDPKVTLSTHDQRLYGFETVQSPSFPMDSGNDGLHKLGCETSRPYPNQGNTAVSFGTVNDRRNISFGTFRFALFQGTLPESLNIVLTDKAKALVQAKGVEEHSIPLQYQLLQDIMYRLMNKGASKQSTCIRNITEHVSRSKDEFEDGDSFVLHALVSSPGAIQFKIVFDVRICFLFWKPVAICNMVTSQFQSVLAELKSDSSIIRTRFPKAKDMKYLFVGGLFTDHYPMYFVDNVRFMKDHVGASVVHSVNIHTEASVQTNAGTIRQAVLDYSRGDLASIVLISHSKGGVDVCSAIARFGDIHKYIFGVITFQSPFCGTFLVDFLQSKALTRNVLLGTIKNIWGGDGDAVLDIGYDARLQDVLIRPYAVASVSSFGIVKSQSDLTDDASLADKLRLYSQVPMIAFSSSASFSIQSFSTLATAAGFASMAPTARLITERTGFLCDGLVSPCDARIPYADLVELSDMMHTEPALFFKGSRYPPGLLTGAAVSLLFDKVLREYSDRFQASGTLSAQSSHIFRS